MTVRVRWLILAATAFVATTGCIGTSAAEPPLLRVDDVPGYTLDGSTDPDVLGGMCGVQDALGKLGEVEEQRAFMKGDDVVTFVRVKVHDDEAWSAASTAMAACEPVIRASSSGTVTMTLERSVALVDGPEVDGEAQWYTQTSKVNDSAGYTGTTSTTNGVLRWEGDYVIAVTAPTQSDVERYVTAATEGGPAS